MMTPNVVYVQNVQQQTILPVANSVVSSYPASQSVKPAIPAQPATLAPQPQSPAESAANWKCEKCSNANAAGVRWCKSCGDAAPPPTPTPSSANFIPVLTSIQPLTQHQYISLAPMSMMPFYPTAPATAPVIVAPAEPTAHVPIAPSTQPTPHQPRAQKVCTSGDRRSGRSPPRENDWICPSCSNCNWESRRWCKRCGVLRNSRSGEKVTKRQDSTASQQGTPSDGVVDPTPEQTVPKDTEAGCTKQESQLGYRNLRVVADEGQGASLRLPTPSSGGKWRKGNSSKGPILGRKGAGSETPSPSDRSPKTLERLLHFMHTED